jgi:1-deoxy-D-xylulose-5-phosphate reductoisomerase
LKRRIAILGSTGSIGTQALDVIRHHADHFEVEVLTAQSSSAALIRQATEFRPNSVVIGDETRYRDVYDALSPLDIKVFAGREALLQIVEMDTIDMVLVAMVGFAALQPTLRAIGSGKPIAIANKETFVVAGEIVTALAREKAVNIFPVDSEHSAIFQCLAGEFHNPVEKVILTASGGPFRGKDREFLAGVTKEQALKHPNWSMGCKVTIDSATLMNKGLEVIEAKWLFNLAPKQIEVVVHPQSIIHSMVQFADGSIKAQMGLPDMRLPIQYALSYPQRLASDFPRFNFADFPELTFSKPDSEIFRNLALAYEALDKGGNMPCILNAADEIAVHAFLKDKVGFTQMTAVIEHCMQQVSYISSPAYDDYVHTDAETRRIAEEIVARLA